MSHKGSEEILHFVMGIEQGELELNDALSKAITLFDEFNEDSVLLPYTVWSRLGLQGGEVLSVTIEAEGYGTERLKLRAAGFFREDALTSLEDPDGLLFLPFITREGRPVYANASDIIIANSKLLLGLLKPPEGGACLLYTSPSPRDKRQSRMPSSA